MKKIFSLLLVFLLFALPVFAQEEAEQNEPLSIEEQLAQIREELDRVNQRANAFRVSGEAKTGLYWRSTQDDGKEPDEYLGLHSMDDAGGEQGQGRFRLDMEYESASGLGFKSRMQWQNWQDFTPDRWIYAFGYGNFFDNQLTVSVGKLGASPWRAGGPYLWKDLAEVDKSGGMMVEYKPNFIPEKYGKINAGFVLNYFNSDRDQGWHQDRPITMWMILQESTVGIAYTHELFHFRFSYKGDSEYDAIQDNKQTGGHGEDEIVYRIEEHYLKNFVPGLGIYALGHLFGMTADRMGFDSITLHRNYFIIDYKPPLLFNLTRPFEARLLSGLDYTPDRSVVHVRPEFYWIFFDMVGVGGYFWYGNDFGNKVSDDWFTFIEAAPKVQVNFDRSYIAFEYNWRREYFHKFLAVEGFEPLRQTQKMNLRFCIQY